jgi:hypothetical protein
MGRPIKKVNLGTYAGAIGIRCEAYIGGSNQNDVFIVKQVASKKYIVQDASVGTSSNTRAKLVATTPAATGEMRVTGYVAGSATGNLATMGGTPKYAAKITQRRFIASDGTRFKWTLVNDSTQDYIELTAI